MPPRDINNLRKARAEVAAIEGQRNALLVELSAAEEAAAALRTTEATPRTTKAIEKKLQTLRDRLDVLAKKEAGAFEAIEGLKDRIRVADPETLVGQLNGGVPVTMFPLRLETRFGNGNKSLRIRVFPEQLHIDSHEPELTIDETAAGHLYWNDRWAAGTDADARRAAWTRLARSGSPSRARWIVRATTPTNLDSLGTGEPQFPDVAQRAGPWTRAPVARLLPEQWVAIGFKDGAEVFRRWSNPVAETVAVGPAPDPAPDPAADPDDEAGDPPTDQSTLPIDAGMKWMVDYPEAVRVGMALTVTDADLVLGTLAGGLDELVVVGVDWTLEPAAAALAVAEQLGRHAVSDGLALLGPGTPTNNTDEERAAPGTDPALDPDALDPTDIDEAVHTASERIGRALGLPDVDAFEGIPGHGHLTDAAAGDMNTALWAPTLDYFLHEMMNPLVTSATADLVGAHFREFVRGRGPFACLRVGRQPYGVLPVTAGDYVGDDEIERAMSSQLQALRPFWANAVDKVPRMGDGDRPDVDLVELLRRRPRSAAFRFRAATGPSVTSNLAGLTGLAALQEQLAMFLLGLLGIDGRPRLAQVTLNPNHRGVPVPLIAGGELSDTDPLDPNYIDTIRAMVSSSGGFLRIVDDPTTASSLLEALLRHAAALEIAIGVTRLVVRHEIATGVLLEPPRIDRVPEREVHDQVTPGKVRSRSKADPKRGGVEASILTRVEGSVELTESKVASIAGNLTLGDFLTSAPEQQLLSFEETKRFVAFRAALGRLAAVPTAELGRLAAETLDCASFRADAWFTSLATRRLDRIRGNQVAGSHIGAFGYVEDLVPSGTTTSAGYLHAPSIAHATTAAILRSGHLARKEDDDEILAIDLSSKRVSLALELLEGVQRGQPIGALLGYYLERWLRVRRITLAKYILPLRQAAPLTTSESAVAPGPVEAIAARDVVDGVKLLHQWKTNRDALYGGLSIPVSSADRADIDLEMQRLDDAFDAVSDVLVAESVHQAVMGNSVRSAAALDALDRQSAIPDIGVVRTPRSGTSAGYRLLVLVEATGPGAGWEALSDARRSAEPRLDAWAGTVLGRADRFRFAAEVRDGAGTAVERLSAELPDLGLSALATVCACAASAPGGATELEERLVVHFTAAASADGADHLVLLEDPPEGSPASAVGLRDLLELGGEVLDLLAGARPADARALAPDTEQPDSGVNAVDLQTRADAAVAELSAAIDGLGAVAPEDTAATVAALLALAAAGRRNAVPVSSDAEALSQLAALELSTSRALLSELEQSEAAFDRTDSEPSEHVEHDLRRLRGVFGESFPVLPVFSTTFASDLTASVSDSALLGGDPLAPSTWLAQHALVRRAPGRLAGVLRAAEMLGGGVGLTSMSVAQLPFAPGDPWIGLPRAVAAARPAGSVSIVAHMASPVDFSAPMAGIVVDQWSDVIPSTHETTAASFHFNAPGAFAPQTVLVAVPGDLTAGSWTVDALAGAVREVIALARIRCVDLDDLEMVGRFLPAIYLPFNMKNKTPSLNLSALITSAIEFDNAAFDPDEGALAGPG